MEIDENFASEVVKEYKRARLGVMPPDVIFTLARKYKISVLVNGRDEKTWKKLFSGHDDHVALESLDKGIVVTCGKQRVKFDWKGERKLVVTP